MDITLANNGKQGKKEGGMKLKTFSRFGVLIVKSPNLKLICHNTHLFLKSWITAIYNFTHSTDFNDDKHIGVVVKGYQKLSALVGEIWLRLKPHTNSKQTIRRTIFPHCPTKNIGGPVCNNVQKHPRNSHFIYVKNSVHLDMAQKFGERC